MDRKFYFVCRRCRWWFRTSEKTACPQCGSKDVQAKRVDAARPKGDPKRAE
jgi:rRNA maturation endonuclease Nob1